MINNDLDFANMIFPLILFKCLFELEDDQIKDLAQNINAVFEKGHWMHKKVTYSLFTLDHFYFNRLCFLL